MKAAGTQALASPVSKTAEDSQSVGPMRSEFKLTEEELHVCCWQNLYYVLLLLKRREAAASNLLQRDKSCQPTIFQITQASTAYSSYPLHRKL
jgi:hypothetical protein